MPYLLDALVLDLLLVALVPVAVVAALVLRRRLLVRDAGFEMALRDRRGDAARGWAYGIARYVGDELLWYRTFSVRPGPSRRMDRGRLQVVRGREPTPAERAAVPRGHLVVECRDGERDIDVSMTGSALTGLVAWRESAPPGRDIAA